jgi:hypothetical protein
MHISPLYTLDELADLLNRKGVAKIGRSTIKKLNALGEGPLPDEFWEKRPLFTEATGCAWAAARRSASGLRQLEKKIGAAWSEHHLDEILEHNQKVIDSLNDTDRATLQVRISEARERLS